MVKNRKKSLKMISSKTMWSMKLKLYRKDFSIQVSIEILIFMAMKSAVWLLWEFKVAIVLKCAKLKKKCIYCCFIADVLKKFLQKWFLSIPVPTR